MQSKLSDRLDGTRWRACAAACYVLLCGLCVLPVLAQSNRGSRNFRFVYKYSEQSRGSLKAFYRGKCVLDLGMYQELPCSPVFDDTSGEIVVGHDNVVEAYSLDGRVLWKREVDYTYNPHRLLANSGVVIYDDGANSVPPPTNPQQLRSAIEDSYSSPFVTAHRIRTGKEAWSLPWPTIGTPCATLQRRYFLSVRPPIPTRLSNYGSFKNTSIDSRSAKTGKLICRWRVPDWNVGTSSRDKVMLGEFLCYGTWTAVPGSHNASFVVTPQRGTMDVDEKETVSQKCFIQVVGSNLSLSFQGKSSSKRTTIQPLRGRR